MQPETSFAQQPYETRNYCYLAVATPASPMPGAPLRIASESAAVGDTSGTTTPATFLSRVHQEMDNEYWPDATPIQAIDFDGNKITGSNVVGLKYGDPFFLRVAK